MDDPADKSLPLGEAVLAWADPEFLDWIRTVEARYTRYELASCRWPRLVSDNALRQPAGTDWMAGGSDTGPLNDAWAKLVSQLQRKIRTGHFHLTGVMTRPDLTTRPQSIPGVWASELKFDLVNDVIDFQRKRFVSVHISESAPESETEAPALLGGRLPPITLDNMRDLSDDEVLLLLEEHARRVVENSDSRLIDPQKVSFGPILLRKMRLRGERGEMNLVLAREAEELGVWLRTKIQSHSIPTRKTIENLLREFHRDLKPQSRPTMP